jgi:MFS family permease
MRKSTWQFFPIWLTFFIDFLGIALVVPIFAPMLLDPETAFFAAGSGLGLKGTVLGLLISIYPFGQFIGGPILGRLSDKHGRKNWLLISLFLSAVGYAITALGVVLSSLTLLFIGRGLCGLMGGNGSIVQSVVSDIGDKERKAERFGYLGLAVGLGFILGPVAGGQLANPDLVSWFTFETPFWFATLLTLANLGLTSWLFQETHGKHAETPPTFWTDLKHLKDYGTPLLWRLFFVYFFFVLGWFFFAQFFQVYLIQKFDFNQVEIGNTYTYIAIWYAIWQIFLVRRVSVRFSGYKIAWIATLVLPLVLVSLLWPQTPWPLFVIFPVLILLIALAWPCLLALVSDHAAEDRQGEVLGLNQSLQSLGQAITPAVSGPLIAQHMTLPTYFAAGCAFAAWLILALKKPSTFEEAKHSLPRTPSLGPLHPPQPPD